jgi:hypothetical protein
MKTMKSMLAVGLLALSFAGIGCGSDADTSKMEKAAKAMCECKDEACIDKTRDEYRSAMKDLTSKFKKKEDAPKDLVAKVEKIEESMRDCRDKAREAAKGAAPAEGN